jgi:hypothetical protein
MFKESFCRFRAMCVDCVWSMMAHAQTRFRLSAKRTSPFKSAEASVQSTAGSRGVRISGSNAEYTMFRGSAKSAGYSLNSPVSSSLPLPCVTVCHHISTGFYLLGYPNNLIPFHSKRVFYDDLMQSATIKPTYVFMWSARHFCQAGNKCGNSRKIFTHIFETPWQKEYLPITSSCPSVRQYVRME